MGLDFFILEFLEKATNDTAEKFYLSVFKTSCSITDTSIRSVYSNSYKDLDGYKTKIMDILISDTQSECRKKLLSHFNALYNSYESFQFFSKKAQIRTYEEDDNEENGLVTELELLNSKVIFYRYCIDYLKTIIDIASNNKLEFNEVLNLIEKLKHISEVESKTNLDLAKELELTLKELQKREQELRCELEKEYESILENRNDYEELRKPKYKYFEEDSALRSGRLTRPDYNKAISRLIDLFVKEGFYIEVKGPIIKDYEKETYSFLSITRYWHDEICDFKTKDYNFLCVNSELKIENTPVQPKFKSKYYFNSYFMPTNDRGRRLKLTAISLKLKLYKDLVSIISDINKKEPCIWCTPTTSNKGKCKNCLELYRAYADLAKEANKYVDKKALLPVDLTQIIRRERKKCSNLDDLTKYRKQIKEKILKKLDSCYSSQTEKHQNIEEQFLKVKTLLDISFRECV